MPPLGEPVTAGRDSGRHRVVVAVVGAASLLVGVLTGALLTLALVADDERGEAAAAGSSSGTAPASTAPEEDNEAAAVVSDDEGRRHCLTAMDRAAAVVELLDLGVDAVRELDVATVQDVSAELAPLAPSLRSSIEECRSDLAE